MKTYTTKTANNGATLYYSTESGKKISRTTALENERKYILANGTTKERYALAQEDFYLTTPGGEIMKNGFYTAISRGTSKGFKLATKYDWHIISDTDADIDLKRFYNLTVDEFRAEAEAERVIDEAMAEGYTTPEALDAVIEGEKATANAENPFAMTAAEVLEDRRAEQVAKDDEKTYTYTTNRGNVYTAYYGETGSIPRSRWYYYHEVGGLSEQVIIEFSKEDGGEFVNMLCKFIATETDGSEDDADEPNVFNLLPALDSLRDVEEADETYTAQTGWENPHDFSVDGDLDTDRYLAVRYHFTNEVDPEELNLIDEYAVSKAAFNIAVEAEEKAAAANVEVSTKETTATITANVESPKVMTLDQFDAYIAELKKQAETTANVEAEEEDDAEVIIDPDEKLDELLAEAKRTHAAQIHVSSFDSAEYQAYKAALTAVTKFLDGKHAELRALLPDGITTADSWRETDPDFDNVKFCVKDWKTGKNLATYPTLGALEAAACTWAMPPAKKAEPTPERFTVTDVSNGQSKTTDSLNDAVEILQTMLKSHRDAHAQIFDSVKGEIVLDKTTNDLSVNPFPPLDEEEPTRTAEELDEEITAMDIALEAADEDDADSEEVAELQRMKDDFIKQRDALETPPTTPAAVAVAPILKCEVDVIKNLGAGTFTFSHAEETDGKLALYFDFTPSCFIITGKEATLVEVYTDGTLTQLEEIIGDNRWTREVVNGEEVVYYNGAFNFLSSDKYDAWLAIHGQLPILRIRGLNARFAVDDDEFFKIMAERGACTLDPEEPEPTVDNFTAERDRLTAERDSAEAKLREAEKALQAARLAAREAQDKLYDFMADTVSALNERINLPVDVIEVKSANGYSPYIYLDTVTVSFDNSKLIIRGNCSEINGLTLGTYDTPEQVSTVIDGLKAAIERGDKRFTFPPAENTKIATVTLDKAKLTDSLERALKIAVTRANIFASNGQITAAETERAIAQICRDARREVA